MGLDWQNLYDALVLFRCTLHQGRVSCLNNGGGIIPSLGAGSPFKKRGCRCFSEDQLHTLLHFRDGITTYRGCPQQGGELMLLHLLKTSYVTANRMEDEGCDRQVARHRWHAIFM